MIIKADLERMAQDIGHAGAGLKVMLDAMEVPSHARDLLLQLNSQRTKGFLCDVIIVVQNALFRAHKNILAASSHYLKSLVVHDNLINLDHEMVSPGVFRVILDYIYTGRLSEGDPTSASEPSLGAVLAAASYLQLLDLVALCKKKLKRNGKYLSRPSPAFLPYPKLGPSSLGLGSGRYRISTPVIQSCPPGGIVNSLAPRPPPLEELVPHRLGIHTGELYAPTSTQATQVFPSPPSGLSAQLSLRSAHLDSNCSPMFGLDLTKKSPSSQSQHTPTQSHLPSSQNDEEREGALSGHTSPLQGINGRPFPNDKLETSETAGALSPASFPHLNQPLAPHLPHLHRSASQNNASERFPCPPSPDTPTEGADTGREMGNIYRWVKHEPISYPVEDEDEEDDDDAGENGEQHHNHHKVGEESEGAEDKSGSGTEETGSSEGRPSPTGPRGRFHMSYEPESFGDNLYVCIPCDKGFPSSEQLNAHVETHTEEELYITSGGEMGNGNSNTKNNSSNTNGYSGHNSSSLNSLSHLETKSSQALGAGVIGDMIRPYRCSSCEKSYKDPATLRQHEKTHWLTRPYPCSICGKKFTQRGTMTRHMRSHLGLKPFACDSCGMRFTRQYRLTEHMRIHSGEKPYECQVCGGKFAQQRNLISHMKMHSSGGTAGGLTDGKLKLDFTEGIYPLTKYTAEHLGLKQENASELLLQAQQQFVAEAKALESLYPLSKMASEHLGLPPDKMDILGQPLPLQTISDTRTIDRYSPT